jgi:hypothetical protein
VKGGLDEGVEPHALIVGPRVGIASMPVRGYSMNDIDGGVGRSEVGGGEDYGCGENNRKVPTIERIKGARFIPRSSGKDLRRHLWAGTAEKIAGKIVGNVELIERGNERKVCVHSEIRLSRP